MSQSRRWIATGSTLSCARLNTSSTRDCVPYEISKLRYAVHTFMHSCSSLQRTDQTSISATEFNRDADRTMWIVRVWKSFCLCHQGISQSINQKYLTCAHKLTDLRVASLVYMISETGKLKKYGN